jgi:hypothetical protein
MGDFYDGVATRGNSRTEKVAKIQNVIEKLLENPRVRLQIVGGNHDTLRLTGSRREKLADGTEAEVVYKTGRIDADATRAAQNGNAAKLSTIEKMIANESGTKKAADDTGLVADAVTNLQQKYGGKVQLLTEKYDEFTYVGKDGNGNPMFAIHVPPNRGVNMERVINPPNQKNPRSLPLEQIKKTFGPNVKPVFLYADQHVEYNIRAPEYSVIGVGPIATHGQHLASRYGRVVLIGGNGDFVPLRLDLPDTGIYSLKPDDVIQSNYLTPNPQHYETMTPADIRPFNPTER